MQAREGGSPQQNVTPPVHLRCARCCERKGLRRDSTCQRCYASAAGACGLCAQAATSIPGTTAAHPQQHVKLPNHDLCVDAFVARAVIAVNEAGLRTADSCQGWPQAATGTLTFDRPEDAALLMRALALRLPDHTWVRANLRATGTGGGDTVLFADLIVAPDLWSVIEQAAQEL